ncbi:unnamed protein product [Effrenium voratum]|uniref:Cyclic nucleotide-binding domain-containing protein n=1 Tax=Effrenium voratum TaxID=2562239 RepID=A0AA36JC78_9DINO|nr:unnamed protein product [Effrenium voratum]
MMPARGEMAGWPDGRSRSRRRMQPCGGKLEPRGLELVRGETVADTDAKNVLLRHDSDEVEGKADEQTSTTGARSRALRRILTKLPEERSKEEVEEVFVAMEKMSEAFLTNLDKPVKRAICERLQWEEFQENERVFDFGSVGDKLYIIWSGRVQLEVPREKTEAGDVHFVKQAKMEAGKVFGEIALMSDDCKRKGRCTTLKHTELWSLHRDDYRWSVGMSQQNTVRERAAFLKCVEEGLLEDMKAVDLQAMAGSLTEDGYIGEHKILEQGQEVDRVIFVKSGFCKVVRQLHPKFTETFCRYANYGEPMPNPYAQGEDDGLRVGEKGVWPRRRAPGDPKADGKASGAAEGQAKELRKLLRLVQDEEREEKRPQRTDTTSSSTAASHESCDRLTVVVDIISKGSSVGVMELMEGLTYQCTVISSPLAEIYSISKFDFIRNVSRPITHRLFCNYKARVSDKQLIMRLVQKYRWEHYKRGLLEEIRSWHSSASRGIIDREEPVPFIGASALGDETCIRVGKGEKLWDRRAQTPPNEAYDPDRAVKQIFHVQCTRDDEGKPVVNVEREQRDASMDDFERKLLETMANARYRDKLRRTANQVAAGQAALEDGKKGNNVAQQQELEEAAKKTLEAQKQKEKERIEGLRQAARDKVKQDRDRTQVRDRRTLRASADSGSQSARSSRMSSKRSNTQNLSLPAVRQQSYSSRASTPRDSKQSARARASRAAEPR